MSKILLYSQNLTFEDFYSGGRMRHVIVEFLNLSPTIITCWRVAMLTLGIPRKKTGALWISMVYIGQ